MRHTQMEIVCSVFDEFRNLQHIFKTKFLEHTSSWPWYKLLMLHFVLIDLNGRLLKCKGNMF